MHDDLREAVPAVHRIPGPPQGGRCIELAEDLAALRADLAIAHTACTETERDMAATIVTLRAELARYQDANPYGTAEELMDSFTALRAEAERLRDDLAGVRSGNFDLHGENQSLRAMVTQLRDDIAHLKARIMFLESENSVLREDLRRAA